MCYFIHFRTFVKSFRREVRDITETYVTLQYLNVDCWKKSCISVFNPTNISINTEIFFFILHVLLINDNM